MTLHDPRALRDAFGAFMTGVTVVTGFDAAGRPLGFTANSFASVSLEPPLLLVSIARSSQNHDVFAAAPGFAVNILAEDQKELSVTFARPVPERFAGVDWQTGPAGSPVLAGVSAWFDCHRERQVSAGDHTILIGSIGAFKSGGAPGLGYYRGSYITPVQTANQLATGPNIVVSAILQQKGMVLLLEDGNGALGLPTAQVGREGMRAALERMIAATGLQAPPGVVYSIYEDSAQGRQHVAFLCPMAAGMARKGKLVALQRDSLAAIGDDAQRKMLERLLEESRQGNYGLYFGNRDQGLVHALGAGGNP